MERYLITGLLLTGMTFLMVGVMFGVGIGLYLILWGNNIWEKKKIKL